MEEELPILLIEASHEQSLAGLLNRNNLANSILHFRDGNKALDYLFRSGAYAAKKTVFPRLILLDLSMPLFPGMELLRQIKSDQRTRAIPCAVLVKSADDPVVAKCAELGVDVFISQPYEFGAFARAMIQLGMYWMMLELPRGK
jgi:two-component system, response regulator